MGVVREGGRQVYLECPRLLSCGDGITMAATAATVAGGTRERSGTSGEGSFKAVKPSGCGRLIANGLMGRQLV